MSFAFVFPGQGSQSLKMMDGMAEFSEVKETFAIASRVLDVDFWSLLQEETPDKINQTVNTQPLMLISGYATYLAWKNRQGKLPSIVAGHSLGEWTALVVSGVIKFTDALKLVKFRAEVMQEAVAPGAGAMAAVLGMDDDAIVKICQQVSQETNLVVAGVNFNSPGQVVIAGDKVAVDKAMLVLKDSGAKKVQLLSVSVPSHCKLMLNASNKLAKELSLVEFSTPQIPIVHNYNAKIYADNELIKDALVKQLYLPVLWTDVINIITSRGINKIVECGSGKVLSGLNKRINKDIISYNLHNQMDFDKALTEL